ncbi:hypothetical protein AVEN_223519-1 [Araneus ventricosus]|uniref:Uncharacterized protein n=1 Tax=Araneus ventricosus TaxID=182803 RepID=A0A4Y2M7S3_ARAVE|nr:hypothetical protein AVEN_223519-1 [Araneus ventricosus]
MARDQGKKLVVELPECDALIGGTLQLCHRDPQLFGVEGRSLSLSFSAIPRGGRLSHDANSTYTMSTYTRDLYWNWISNLESFDPEGETLQLCHHDPQLFGVEGRCAD